jgi:hypothetical protein
MEVLFFARSSSVAQVWSEVGARLSHPGVDRKGSPSKSTVCNLAVVNNWDSASKSSTGPLEVFATPTEVLGASVPLLHIWQSPVNGAWGIWQSLGGQFSAALGAGNTVGVCPVMKGLEFVSVLGAAARFQLVTERYAMQNSP